MNFLSKIGILVIFFVVSSRSKLVMTDDKYYVPQVDLYEQVGQVGFIKSLPVDRPVTDLSREVGNKHPKSAKVTGAWIFYEDKNFNAGSDAGVEKFYRTHGEGVNFAKFPGNIGSARYVGYSTDCRKPTITFFGKTNFQGVEQFLPHESSNFDSSVSASFIITGAQAYTFYDQPDFKGKSITVQPEGSANYEPAFVPDIRSVIGSGHIKSIRKGRGGEQIVTLPVGQ